MSGAARQTGHEVGIAVTGAMMLMVIGYVAWHSRSRFGSHFQVYGPLYLTIIATLMIMADPTRHVLQDTNVWPSPSSDEYRDNCNTEDMSCLTVTGWLVTIMCTYLGFAVLTVATLWNANIYDKIANIKEKWRQLRQPNDDDDEEHLVQQEGDNSKPHDKLVDSKPVSTPGAYVVDMH